MKKENLREHIDASMENIQMTDALRKRMLDGIAQEGTAEHKPSPKRISRKKLVIIAAAAALVMAFPLTVGAQKAYEAVSAWVASSVTGEEAKHLYAVEDSVTDNGIRVAVESALNDSHNARIFITIQDVEGKNRLAEDIDLCDTDTLTQHSFWHEMAYGSAALDSYDPDTQTARFCVYSGTSGDFADRPVTFSVRSIMAHKTHYPTADTGIDLAAIVQANPSTGGKAIKKIYGIGYVNCDQPKQPKAKDILTPDVMDIPLGGEFGFVHISNIGYVNGRLHIQTRWDESFDNHGWLNLCRADITDYDREDLADYYAFSDGITSIDFATAEDLSYMGKETRTKHIEYLFDVKPDELKHYRLLACDFVKDGQMIHGNWQIRFRTQHTDSLTLKGEKGETVEITTLGVYVAHYTGKNEPQVVITYADGSTETVDAFPIQTVGLFSKVCYSDVSREKAPDEIASVTLDGKPLVKS